MDAMTKEMERSRHCIEVAELEGIQAQMMKEIEEKDVRIGGLETEMAAQAAAYEQELAALREALAAEQAAKARLQADLVAEQELRAAE